MLQLERELEAAEEVLAQTAIRLSGHRTIPDRRISMRSKIIVMTIKQLHLEQIVVPWREAEILEDEAVASGP